MKRKHKHEIVSETSLEVSPTHPILSSVSQKDLAIIHEVLTLEMSKKMLIIQILHLTYKKVIQKDEAQNRKHLIQYLIQG